MSAEDALSVRAVFLESLSWEGIVLLNKTLCAKSSNVAHGFNRETAAATRSLWEETRHRRMTVAELLDFLFLCHKNAPFLNFNGNIFGEVARQILATTMLGMPVPRVEAASSLAAHFVAGVLDKDAALKGLRALLVAGVLKPGDRVTTLKFTRRGLVTRVLPDGRVAWLPDGRKLELLATPETLLKL